MLAHPIQHTKIHHLGPAALLLCHHVEWYPIHLGGRVRVDINIGIKIANHCLLPRQHCRQAQLKLRIVSIDKYIARCRHKGIANVPPQLTANWDVLQIWVGTTEPARRYHILVEGGVDIARVVGQLWQRLDIRIFAASSARGSALLAQ